MLHTLHVYNYVTYAKCNATHGTKNILSNDSCPEVGWDHIDGLPHEHNLQIPMYVFILSAVSKTHHSTLENERGIPNFYSFSVTYHHQNCLSILEIVKLRESNVAF